MNMSTQLSRFKPAFVLFGFFCTGILVTHFVISLLISGDISKQNEASETVIQKAESIKSSSSNSPSNTMALVSVLLPPPPKAHAIKIAQQRDKLVDGSRQNSVQLNAKQIDTQKEDVIQQGLAMLKNTQQKDAPQIRISLPKGEQQRENIINTLRACMGVTLGKVSGEGKVLAQEKTEKTFSPFLRLVEGKLTKNEQQITKQWRHSSGRIVRFYPKLADAKILGGLQKLVQGSISHVKITGEYRLKDGDLNLVNIKINGKSQQTELRLLKSC